MKSVYKSSDHTIFITVDEDSYFSQHWFDSMWEEMTTYIVWLIGHDNWDYSPKKPKRL